MINTRMYLEESNSGKCLLVHNVDKWYYFFPDSSGRIGDIDFYESITDDDGYSRDITAGELIQCIRDGIESGAIYSAEDFADEADDENYIPEYDGFALDDIDEAVNYETNYSGDRVPKNHDITVWYEI